MKYLKYILILILLVGLFSPMVKINAQSFPNGYNPPTITQTPIILTPASGTSTQVAPPAGNNKNYQLLEPLPCPPNTPGCTDKLTNFDTTGGIGNYLNLMIKIFIGLCAVLSVVMIVIGGLEYMTSELSHSKEAGKEKIMQAILGLLIALGAYALLYTINPDLLISDICISPQVRQDGKCINPAPVVTPVVTPPAVFTPLQIPYSGSNTNNISPLTP